MTKLKHISMIGLFSLLFSFTAQAHNGHHHPKKKKKTKVVVVNTPAHCHTVKVLPKHHRVIVHNRVKYYHFGNRYYVRKKGVYIAVTPPKAVFVIR